MLPTPREGLFRREGYTLSDADAFDVAKYFTRQPRPDFAAKTRDWPKGDRPSDAPY